ncbi:hypothetical protein OO013_19195 [Mangrovivirga sp. M17]|uniref:Capsule assembly Wzi family protein n=1 Tax=Mangrovivirga halotolerans TaxID=2993936 RepID=A0ABT3RWU5_9BACT|nr:hypothetical protein [Mangrovivirga halotolerans]MCX2746016.1 hypothetical protein [Mangrovivirga halotolerans]
MRQVFFFSLTFLFLSLSIKAQSIRLDRRNYQHHLIDRFEIRTGKQYPGFHSTMKTYRRDKIDTAYYDMVADSTEKSDIAASLLLYNNWEYISEDAPESDKPLFNFLYKTPGDFWYDKGKKYDLHVNPILHLAYMNQNTETDGSLFINTRGVKVRGRIGNKVAFFTSLTENQARYPSYINRYINENIVVPNQGFWKEFKDTGVDFFEARGYISFDLVKDMINLQFGHDRLFIGNGYRSMILSDFSAPMLFLKLETEVGKVNYTNIFAELTADIEGNQSGLTGSGRYPKKYLAQHRIGIDIGKSLNIGLFESVVIYEDSASANIELGYLNPIIFYRAIEQNEGSQDNVLLGLDWKWNFLNHFSFYGQLSLDEFVLSEYTDNNGWWANKNAVQVGMKYIDAFGIPYLDLQGEFNTARPYMYSHKDSYGSFSHYGQPLAHPRGANFTELIGIARYKIIPRLDLTLTGIISDYGSDEDGGNWGGDILKPNITREQNYDNETGQGVNNSLFIGEALLTYMPKNNLFIDLGYTIRNQENEILGEFNENWLSVGVRWNIARQNNLF